MQVCWLTWSLVITLLFPNLIICSLVVIALYTSIFAPEHRPYESYLNLVLCPSQSQLLLDQHLEDKCQLRPEQPYLRYDMDLPGNRHYKVATHQK